MRHEPWHTLGLDPAGPIDVRAVRSAYAAQLKRTRPEDDPDRFARLRWAYELALTWLERQAQFPAPASSATPAAPNSPREPPPAAQAPAPSRLHHAAGDAKPAADPPLPDALQRSVHPHDAAERILQLCTNAHFDAQRLRDHLHHSDDLLPLGMRERIGLVLARRAAATPALLPAALLVLAREFDWEDVGAMARHRELDHPVLRARLDEAHRLLEPHRPALPPATGGERAIGAGMLLFALLTAGRALSGRVVGLSSRISLPVAIGVFCAILLVCGVELWAARASDRDRVGRVRLVTYGGLALLALSGIVYFLVLRL